MARGICPKCGQPGSGPHVRWAKDRRFRYMYFAHRYKDETGWKTRWCYLGKAPEERPSKSDT